tara:strand:- start:185 stop:343 length:159 start_codon:yes stop_codon:yes gene_type:complete
MLELGDALFGVGKVHGKSVFQTMEKILGCELEMLVGNETRGEECLTQGSRGN